MGHPLRTVDQKFVRFLSGETVEVDKDGGCCYRLDSECDETVKKSDMRVVPVNMDPTPNPAHFHPLPIIVQGVKS